MKTVAVRYRLTYVCIGCSRLTTWTKLHAAVLIALPIALARVSRKPLVLLDDVLEASASLTNNLLSTLLVDKSDNIAQAAVKGPEVEAGGNGAANCTPALVALEGLVLALAAVVWQWPKETCEAGLLKIHSYQLRALDECTLTVPLAYDNSSDIDRMPVPLPALLECLNKAVPEENCKHGAQFVVYMTSALVSTGFNFWQDIGHEERQSQEEGLLSQLNRGRALAAQCLLCAKGLESCTTAGQPSGTAFLEEASQLSLVLLKAADTYQVNLHLSGLWPLKMHAQVCCCHGQILLI
jgi:hypothetical protein